MNNTTEQIAKLEARLKHTRAKQITALEDELEAAQNQIATLKAELKSAHHAIETLTKRAGYSHSAKALYVIGGRGVNNEHA